MDAVNKINEKTLLLNVLVSINKLKQSLKMCEKIHIEETLLFFYLIEEAIYVSGSFFQNRQILSIKTLLKKVNINCTVYIFIIFLVIYNKKKNSSIAEKTAYYRDDFFFLSLVCCHCPVLFFFPGER